MIQAQSLVNSGEAAPLMTAESRAPSSNRGPWYLEEQDTHKAAKPQETRISSKSQLLFPHCSVPTHVRLIHTIITRTLSPLQPISLDEWLIIREMDKNGEQVKIDK